MKIDLLICLGIQILGLEDNMATKDFIELRNSVGARALNKMTELNIQAANKEVYVLEVSAEEMRLAQKLGMSSVYGLKLTLKAGFEA